MKKILLILVAIMVAAAAFGCADGAAKATETSNTSAEFSIIGTWKPETVDYNGRKLAWEKFIGFMRDAGMNIEKLDIEMVFYVDGVVSAGGSSACYRVEEQTIVITFEDGEETAQIVENKIVIEIPNMGSVTFAKIGGEI